MRESKEEYKDDLRDGKAEYFHPNGERQAAGQWTADKKQGRWVFFDDKGKKTEEAVYKDDVVIGKPPRRLPTIRKPDAE